MPLAAQALLGLGRGLKLANTRFTVHDIPIPLLACLYVLCQYLPYVVDTYVAMTFPFASGRSLSPLISLHLIMLLPSVVSFISHCI